MAQVKSSLHMPALGLLMALSLSGCSSLGLNGDAPPTVQKDMARSYNYYMTEGADARRLGNLDKAADLFMKAAQDSPQAIEPLLELGDTLWQLKKAEQSANAFALAHTLDPQNDAVLRNMGRAFVAMGKADEARDAYQQALAINANHPKTLNGLGVAYGLAGNHVMAQSQYRAGLAIAPNDGVLLNNLAFSLITTKDYQGAVDLLEPLVGSDQASDHARNNLALAYGLLGKDAEVRRIQKAMSPADIAHNLAIYNQLRTETDHSQTMAEIGKPVYVDDIIEVPQVKIEAAPAAPASVAAPVPTPVVAAPLALAPAAPPAGDQPTLEKPVVIAPVPPPVTTTALPTFDMPALSPAVAPVVPPAPTAEVKLGSLHAQDDLLNQGAGKSQVLKLPSRLQPTETIKLPDFAAPEPVVAAPAMGTGNRVYLGAFTSEKEATARWARLKANNSVTIGKLTPAIDMADGQAKLYAVGAADSAQAGMVCQRLQSVDIDCSLAQ